MLFALLQLISLAFTPTFAQQNAQAVNTKQELHRVLNENCLGCHGAESPEADIDLTRLTVASSSKQLPLLNKVHEQVLYGLMPPADADTLKKQAKQKILAWTRTELRKHNALDIDSKIRYPGYGNLVEHETLFKGTSEVKASSPARRWLIRPQIFRERILDLFQLTGRERQQFASHGFYGITNPFVLPDHSGVQDYDTEILNGGHLLVMLTNADWISRKQLRAARVKNGELKEKEFSNPRDRWFPRQSPKEFEDVILAGNSADDDQLRRAISTQFQLVLQRKPTDKESTDYLTLTREAIEIGGASEGLRQMLVSVLLESEFLYRYEFGSGKPDAGGRKLLSGREAAYAISYALGDRKPDQNLVAAAEQGKLKSKNDFKREVIRLLKDNDYYRGQIDPSLNGKHFQSQTVAHPRLVRFFRNFFGYPGALKVFKDSPRSGGYYSNPGRGSTQTPGFLVLEADRIVAWYLDQDRNVFENLLTTDHFFVYHNRDNETGKQIISEWKEVYQKLKSTDWKTNPEQVLKDNLEFLKEKPHLRIKDQRQLKDFLCHMYYFEESFGKNRTPFTTVPWQHGYTYHHSVFYSLPPTPGIWRYGKSVNKNFKGFDSKEFWDYPVKQPFQVKNRKGMLTHPAWLIAHSQNAVTDPVRRGKWIREKLLAGFVPDVPITVDAMVPDDPNHSLRHRLDSVTRQDACWKCHRHMNPLGLAFEMYDDFGRFRTRENLEHPDNIIEKAKQKNGADLYKTVPVDSSGRLDGTGDPELDGMVANSIDLIDRLSQSRRVRQSIIRHAFRFFMGRNEQPSDSKTLIDAEKAYIESSGSFKAVVISLLTSDSFRFRTQAKD